MLPLPLIIFTTLILSACTKTSPTTSPVLSTLDQKKAFLSQTLTQMSDTPTYSATVEVKPASGSATLYQWLSQDISLQKSTHNSFETYYHNHQAIIKHPNQNSWLSLSIPKTDPAKTYGPFPTNLAKWVDIATDSFLTTSPCDTATCTKITLSIHPQVTYDFIIDSDTHVLQQYRLQTTDQTITVNYQFIPVILSLPNQIEPFTIPEKPTDDDLALIQAIYGL